MKGKSSAVRLPQRSAKILLGLLLPFLLVRTAFLVLESATLCSSTIGCLTRRIFGWNDAAMLREELTMALVEATINNDDRDGRVIMGISDTIPTSFNDLVEDVIMNRHDIKAFAFKTKAMISKIEHVVKTAKLQENIYWHLSAHAVPKSIHCLSLKLAEEYAINAAARSRLPHPQYVYRLTDPSFHHVALITDNVLAASVVISSTIETSLNPQSLVFHVVTSKKSFASMHAWFALNTIDSSTAIEVKGLHQYDWSHEVNIAIKEMLEIHHQVQNRDYQNLKNVDLDQNDLNLHALSPTSVSVLNHLRIYLPELFPDLNKVMFLDDDVVVQRDLSYLWDLDLEQKVVGAASSSWCGLDCCPGRKYKDYFNFTEDIISSNLDQERCGWLYGVNVFDLERWRETNITAAYHHWLKHNLNSGFTLWQPGALPPALLAFETHVYDINHSWHLSGLGNRYPHIDHYNLEAAAVLHYSGPAKPWLEIGSLELRNLWTKHVNSSNEHIVGCGLASVQD